MRRFLRRLAILSTLATTIFGLLIWVGLDSAVSTPIERTISVSLPVPGLQRQPIRVALLSDIHFGNRAMSASRLGGIVSQINAAQPDLIVIAGDFVNGHAFGDAEALPEGLVAPLSQLQARRGVFATLGNHDHWTGAGRVTAALEKAGVTVIENRAVRVGPLALIGIDDAYSEHHDLAKSFASAAEIGGLPIVFTHSPDLSPLLPKQVELVLAGHTHCGQVVLPGIGSLAPAFGWLVGDRHYFSARYRCGVVREGNRVTIVTAGLGSGSLPFRIGAPPDWWMVTLKAR
jgi:uncharacterized protein